MKNDGDGLYHDDAYDCKACDDARWMRSLIMMMITIAIIPVRTMTMMSVVLMMLDRFGSMIGMTIWSLRW